MRKLFLVFRHEYVRRVKTRGFVFAVVSMPIMLFLAIGLGVISARVQSNPLPVGLLDNSGLFTDADLAPDYVDVVTPPVDIQLIGTIESGISLLENETLQAVFVIPENYLESGKVDVFAASPPGDNAYKRVTRFIQAALAKNNPPEFVERIQQGSEFTVQAYDGSREANMRDWFVVLFPFMVGLIFIIVINISGGYLMQSVVDEKANRTMEMIVTSLSPDALMSGKILGNLCVGLSQLIIWLLFAAFGAWSIELIFGYGYAPVILPEHWAMLVGIIIPGFILVAGLMTLVAVSAASLREAQQVSMLFTLPMVSPYWFAGAVLENPSHRLSQFMSVFPLTAVITMPLRAAIGKVPVWQIALASALTWLSAIGILFLAARVFRMGMLRYGKRLSLRELLGLAKGRSRG